MENEPAKGAGNNHCRQTNDDGDGHIDNNLKWYRTLPIALKVIGLRTRENLTNDVMVSVANMRATKD